MISVVIPTYNRAKVLGEAIDSVLAQTFKDFELIVVDNYSSDNTESVVDLYHDKRIRYFKNRNNGLVSINRNYGIEKSQGEYIAFLDDDDLWLPEKLEKQVELLDSNKELGLVYSDCYIIDDAGTLRENTYFAGKKPVRGAALNGLLQNNPIPLLAAVIRREVLDKVGGFNPAYIIAQDYDLWLRIAEYYPIDFVEQPLAKYRVHSESANLKNIGLAYREETEIVDNWLKKTPGLKRELGGKITRRKRSLRKAWFLGAFRQVYHNRNGKSMRELFKFFKYFLSSFK